LNTSRARRLQEPVSYTGMKEALRKDNAILKKSQTRFFSKISVHLENLG